MALELDPDPDPELDPEPEPELDPEPEPDPDPEPDPEEEDPPVLELFPLLLEEVGAGRANRAHLNCVSLVMASSVQL